MRAPVGKDYANVNHWYALASFNSEETRTHDHRFRLLEKTVRILEQIVEAFMASENARVLAVGLTRMMWKSYGPAPSLRSIMAERG